VLQSSRDKDKIRRIRAEIAEQHESMMELICECGIRFKGIPGDIYIYRTLTNAPACHSKSSQPPGAQCEIEC